MAKFSTVRTPTVEEILDIADSFGLTLTICLPNACTSSGFFAASWIALNIVSSTGLGVAAGASMLCQCSVPTPG